MRNRRIEGFLTDVHIEREGFRELTESAEYVNGFSNITIEDGTILNSRGVGIFVDGCAGIYLEAGSKDNVVEDNEIVANGFGENGPAGDVFTVGGVERRFAELPGARATRSSPNSP